MKKPSVILLIPCYMFIKGLILACIFLYSTSLFAQQRTIDSLQALLKSDKEDTNKVNHLNQLGFENIVKGNTIADSVYSSNAMKLAQKLNYTKGFANAYKNMGLYCQDKGDFITALSNFKKALELYNGIGNKNGASATLNNMGSVNYQIGNFEKSLEYYNKSLKLASEIKDKKQEGNVLGNIASIYLDEGNYPIALDFNLKTLQIFDSIGNKTGIASCLGNIGDIYEKMGEYDSALRYDFDALEKMKELDNKTFEANTLSDIGGIYKKKKLFTEAIEYQLKGLQLYKETGNNFGIEASTGNLGSYYQDIGETVRSFSYDSIALEMSTKLGDMLGVSVNSGNIGAIYLDKKGYAKAEKYLLKADSLAQALNAFDFAKDYEKNLARLYTETNQWQKANYYLQKYADAKDSVFNQDKSKQIGRLEAKYNFDKQLTIQQAEADKNKALADAESKRQRIIILLIAAIALSVVLVAILIYRSLKLTKKEKLLVERQKVLLELKALRAQMNPHFIFNAINSIQLFILENDSEAAHEHLATFSQLIRMVLENSRFETIPLSEEIKMLELYLELEDMRFSSKFSFKINVDKSIEKENTLISPLIIQPYVENAIWHGLMHLEGRKGEIVIGFERMNGHMKVSIDDNGIGRKQSMTLKEGSTHESMGLTITKERLEIIKMLYKSNMSVNFIDKTDTDGSSLGTRVELIMPYISNATTYA